ncbi:MAG: protein N-lysine methyltransferase family protein [Methylomonas sp.]|jgi:predicted nicotinamide N-methyase|uniref:class I SAM-dependent methyltransferase n=1 Tax=Methylomonas sp. TaxID=418 RepID=UPI0025E73812|nr:methyltransferase domain-containing protein [Methylomonas sp.]MCK9605588.1 protein N-lysine methyltransferase family protein [Methylomonas sp.]
MPGYQVKHEAVNIGGTDYLIRSLLDLQQYSDPHGEAEQAGLSSTSWSLFGQIWPSARVLALAMDSFNLAGKRILEIGAGLGLASLVIHGRGGNITVSDWHPLSQDFLNKNLLLNRLGPIKFEASDWSELNSELGEFDLIIGSDLLYERQQPGQLAAYIHRHAAPSAEIIIVDPDRGNRVDFCKHMHTLGYGLSMRNADKFLENGDRYKGRFLTFSEALRIKKD